MQTLPSVSALTSALNTGIEDLQTLCLAPSRTTRQHILDGILALSHTVREAEPLVPMLQSRGESTELEAALKSAHAELEHAVAELD